MPQAIDMEYCMIVIDKLISPHTPVEQVEPLLRDLMDSVSHPDMKKLAERIVDPELGLGEKRALMEDFRNFDHGGANSFKDVEKPFLVLNLKINITYDVVRTIPVMLLDGGIFSQDHMF